MFGGLPPRSRGLAPDPGLIVPFDASILAQNLADAFVLAWYCTPAQRLETGKLKQIQMRTAAHRHFRDEEM